MLRARILIPLAACVAIVSGGPVGNRAAHAQDEPTGAPADDPEIAELEAAYQKELAAIHRELGAMWIEALSNLRDSLTREQKFAEALLVRDELQRVTKMLESNQLPAATRTPTKEFTLLPKDAVLAGDVELSKTSEISRWKGVGASVTWRLADANANDLVPGRYEVILNYRCGTNGGGAFKVKVGNDQELAASVTADDSDSSWRRQRSTFVGECSIDPNTRQIQIISTKHSHRDLMNITSVRLAPVGTWKRGKP